MNYKLSSSALKLIALLSMTLDHIAYYCGVSGLAYEVMRSIGRIAFPVFAFLLVEGYIHTHSKQRYFLSLVVFALISQVPWWLLNRDSSLNVFFTLALGLVVLQVIDTLQSLRPITTTTHLWKLPSFIATVVAIATICALATYLDVDYTYRGILLIVLFRLLRGNYPLLALFSLPLMYVYGITGYLLALAVLAIYNHRRGFIPQGSAWKYAFYAYYPVHLTVLRVFHDMLDKLII